MNNKAISLRLRYFPFPGRAGPIRDALRIGKVNFEDVHVPPNRFHEQQAAGEFPFGALPVLDIQTTSGKVSAAQSNAILRYVGRLAKLYPVDDLVQSLKVDEALDMAEDINQILGPSMHEDNIDKKLAMRKLLVEDTLPVWAGYIERLLVDNGKTGFLVGDALSVADLKLYWIIDMLTNGSLDGVPSSLLDGFVTISAWRQNVTAVRKQALG
jgi:prostaglandin-H2 D-isomerase / glutathione transferase